MLRLSKKVEYGILAVQYMAEKLSELITAKEIAEKLDLSFDFLAKTLQTLNKNGLISSSQGVRGGYVLTKSPDEIRLTDIIEALDEKANLVDCFSPDDPECARQDECKLRYPLHILQKKINLIFESTSIAELSKNSDKVQIDLIKKRK